MALNSIAKEERNATSADLLKLVAQELQTSSMKIGVTAIVAGWYYQRYGSHHASRVMSFSVAQKVS